ncbi:hypothetical protein PQR67_06210 [Paraburkholderia fungorum]|uniref:hypothetical protein n=1 Tax=Paraburkholderia fungorum TaxID=134537 RepID=UPI0038BC2FEB
MSGDNTKTGGGTLVQEQSDGDTGSGKVRSAIATCRTRVWLEAARRAVIAGATVKADKAGKDGAIAQGEDQISPKTLSSAYLKAVKGIVRGEQSDPRFYRYANGKSSPNANTVKRVEVAWPGTQAAYEIGPLEDGEPVRLWAAFGEVSTDLWEVVCEAQPNFAHSLLDGRPHYTRIGMMEALVERLADEPEGEGDVIDALRRYREENPPSLRILAGILAFWRLSMLVYDDMDKRVYRMVATAINGPFRAALEQWDAFVDLRQAVVELHTIERMKMDQLVAKYRPAWSSETE